MELQKDLYVSPQSESLELRLEGVIAQSYSYENPFPEKDKW